MHGIRKSNCHRREDDNRRLAERLRKNGSGGVPGHFLGFSLERLATTQQTPARLAIKPIYRVRIRRVMQRLEAAFHRS
jgi:hypothetical protein